MAWSERVFDMCAGTFCLPLAKYTAILGGHSLGNFDDQAPLGFSLANLPDFHTSLGFVRRVNWRSDVANCYLNAFLWRTALGIIRVGRSLQCTQQLVDF